MATNPNDSSSSSRPPSHLTPELRRGLLLLLQAFNYALHTQADPWQFAVSSGELRGYGLTAADLRFLVTQGYAESAREVTRPGASVRKFHRDASFRPTKRTCLVLTPAGADFARAVCSSATMAQGGPAASSATSLPAKQPYYDGSRRLLTYDGQEALRFRRPSKVEGLVLLSFQEQNWREKIDDPLPRVPGKNPARRLRNAVANLNRRLQKSSLRFGSEDNGRAVYWYLL